MNRISKKGVTLYEIVLSMALVALVIAAGISVSVYVGNTISSFNDNTELVNECSVLRQATETWLSYYDNEGYELSLTVGEGGVYETIAATAGQDVYAIAFDGIAGRLTLPYASGDTVMELHHIAMVDFDYLRAANMYVCTAYYGESSFRFTLMPRVRI